MVWRLICSCALLLAVARVATSQLIVPGVVEGVVLDQPEECSWRSTIEFAQREHAAGTNRDLQPRR
jgi:hypothetical protein